ncbi:MAG: alpha/beta hydrolase [Mycobacterium sp.]
MASTVRDVTIPRGTTYLAGQEHLPENFADDGRHAAIVISTPGSSVKEQIGAVYGSRLADLGFVAVASDPAFQGQSGGQPRDLEDPYARADDIRYAVDHLIGQNHVDEARIGILGICAGGGYAVHTAMTDHRLRAVATVVPVNIGRAFRDAATATPDGVASALDSVAQQRTVAARGGEEVRAHWLPDSPEQAVAQGISDPDVLDAIRFYRTSRGFNMHSTNRRLSRSDALLLGFDVFHLADTLLTQPLQVIVGGRVGTTGSYTDGMALAEAAPNTQDVLVIDGAGHYDLYDDPAYVDQAVRQLGTFFTEHLGMR